MKKILFLFLLLLVLVAGVVFVQNYLKTNNLSFFGKSPTLAINDRVFELKVAKSQEEKEIGLSETKSLSDNQGMIFLFDKPDYYSFWMKNMQFSIDIIYIDNDHIVTIFQDVQPPKEKNASLPIFNSTQPADMVLEINSGLSKKYNFKEGDKVTYEPIGN